MLSKSQKIYENETSKNLSFLFAKPEDETKHRARAKYIPQPDGSLRLASIQEFNIPKFREEGWEDRAKPVAKNFAPDELELDELTRPDENNIERASRRAKTNAFDMILCNPDLDTFATFTYSPDAVGDKASYEQCYKRLSIWLSNRVQRRDLKYVIVPERHKSGDIHFHGIMNSAALELSRASSAKTGRALTAHGKPLYNLPEWKFGHTSAEIIGSDMSDRDKVAKYIFKYMGKQLGARIGGRYALIGGKLDRPRYVYGESIEELCDGSQTAAFDREVKIGDGLTFREISYI